MGFVLTIECECCATVEDYTRNHTFEPDVIRAVSQTLGQGNRLPMRPKAAA